MKPVAVDVLVASTVFDVGRAGAVKLSVLVSSGHTSLPQARSVGQQPPPKDAGHERKPEEQTSVFGWLELLKVVVVVIVLSVVVVVVVPSVVVSVVVGGGATVVLLVDVVGVGSEVELGGRGTGTIVLVSVCVAVCVCVCTCVSVSVCVSVEGSAGGGDDDVLDEKGVDDVVGIIVTTAVDVATQPTSKQAYPGTQQPPPGF